VFSGSLNPERPALEHRSPDSGRQDQAASSARADGDQRAIRDRLLMAMGIAPSAYRDLVRSGALPHANALALQLGRLCQQKLIGVHINSELQELSEELERAAQTLKHDTSNGDLIDSTVFELQAILPALLLQQGGRYQETLCKQLLQRLKFHESTLSKISRSESTDWQRVALLIEDFADSADSGDYRPEPDHRRPN
jgi:hypothetical protein